MALRLQKTEQLQTGATSPAESGSTQRRHDLMRIARIGWIAAAAFVALIILIPLVFQIAERDEVRSGVTAFGVDLGGMTRAEAQTVLAEARQQRGNQPIALVDEGQDWQMSQSELGLRIDIDQTVEDAFQTGRSGFGPSRLALLWHFEDEEHEVGYEHIGVAGDSLQTKMDQLAGQINQPTIEAELTVSPEGTFNYVNSQVGREFDREATRSAILGALATGKSQVPVAVNEFPPAASDADYADALNRVQNILDTPITVKAADQTWTFQPHHLAGWLQVVPPEGEQQAQIQIDGNWMAQVVEEIEYAIDRLPQSPRVWWNGDGNLVMTREPQSGASLNVEQASTMIHDAFLGVSNGDTVNLPVETLAAPEVPADLNSLGLNTVIAEASTPYSESIPERKHNLALAAELLNGTLVMPGQTFSFNGEIGPMTTEAGFKNAWGIAEQNGKLRTIPTIAGGICQVATTVFQPVFVTGYRIEQRSTHSYWIPSYSYNDMVGLDATVHPAAGLDLKWTNDSAHPVMVQATANGDQFTVRLIGRAPDWQVEIPPTEQKNVVEAEHGRTYYRPDTSMEVGKQIRVEQARNGFDVRLVRTVRQGDEERVFDVTTTYDPSRNVVVVGSENGELPPGYEQVVVH